MICNFDAEIDRHNTNSVKYDFATERGMPDGLLPFWIADMDFPVPPCVTAALAARVAHPIFGYADVKPSYFRALQQWNRSHFDWAVKEEELVLTPGVVPAIALAIRALTQEGDAVLIQRPVYYPFTEVIEANKRILVNSPLILRNGRYEPDFEDMERQIVEKNVRLSILCSPHNPVGRVWTKEELLRYGDICLRHNVLIIVDEIHSDFTRIGHKQTAFATLGDAYNKQTVICTAPSKIFNVAGLQTSNIWIADPAIRQAFRRELERIGYDKPNLLGLVACEAAYAGGAEWADQVTAYINDNEDFAISYLQKHLPRVSVIPPEGTYLLWIDFRPYGLSEKELERRIVEDAKLWVDMGHMFGEEGNGFIRLNVACPRSTLTKGLDALFRAFA